MSVDLTDYVDSLRREINPLGGATITATSDELVQYLADAFWEARLDGFLEGFDCSPDGIVKPDPAGGEDIGRDAISLVVLYAGIRVLRNKILNTNTGFRAKAGPVEFEQQNSATVLSEMLKQLRATKDRLLERSATAGYATKVSYYDGLSTREYNRESYYGGPELGWH